MKGPVVLGVDLGKRLTPTTIVAVERRLGARVWDSARFCWKTGEASREMMVRWIEAVPLGTSYEGVAQRIWNVAEQAGASAIWMDGTGVGVAVEEMVRARRPAGLRCALRPLMITGGMGVKGKSVGRGELLSRLAVEWEQGRVKVAPGLSRWPELRWELLGLDGEGRKRYGRRDDLALGLALAIWGFTGAGAGVGERAEGRVV